MIILILAALIIGGAVLARQQGWATFLISADRPNPNLNQAVFLINGQVYFGKIVKIARDTLVLDDIYYLQVTPPLQQLSSEELAQLSLEQQEAFFAQQQQMRETGEAGDEPIMNLVKLGSEIHGPKDRMVIPMTSVLYWEDIKNDSIVSQAIREFKTQQSN